MSASREEAAFLEAVRADPDDDGPRLMYADWLTERGDSRGEFIRLQCLLEQTGIDDEGRAALERRTAELLRVHQDEWTRPLRELGVVRVRHRHGFVEAVTLAAERFATSAAALFTAAPVRTVCLWAPRPKDIAALAGSPNLAHVRGLALVGSQLSPADLRAVGTSPYAAGLTGLELDERARVGYEGIRELAVAPMLANLRYLHLHESCRGHDLVESLVGARWQKNLTNLHLMGHQLTADNLLPLLTPPSLPALRTLGLWNNAVGDEELERLLAAGALTRLRRLNLNTNNLTQRGAEALADWPHLGGLELLHVADNGIGHGGIRALIESSYRDRRCALNFCQCSGTLAPAERKQIRDRLGPRSLDLVADWASDRLQP